MPKFNPFRPNGIVRPGMFAGRFEELETIERILFQTKHGNPEHFLIEGERGIGKSSLLLYIYVVARGEMGTFEDTKLNFIVVSTELSPDSDYLDIIRMIAGDLRNQLEKMERVKTLAKGAWSFLTAWEVLGVKYTNQKDEIEPYKALDDLVGTLASIMSAATDEIDGILVLIDEADKAPTSANLGGFVKLLTEKLTKIGCERVSFGLAGLPNLIPKLRESHESAPRVFTTMSLEPLKHDERVEVVKRGLAVAREKNGYETPISREAIDLIASLSDGYPHFVQQFAFSAFDADDDDSIDRQDVVSGAFRKDQGALWQLGKRFFQEMYFDQISSDDYRVVLHAMAEHSDGWVSRASIVKTAGVRESQVDNALNALKTRNIILVNESVRGQYRLPTKSFAAWIKALETGQAATQDGQLALGQ